MLVAICGKARIASMALAHAVHVIGEERLVACPVRDDAGYDTWQPSLIRTAHLLGVEIASVGDLEREGDLVLISLEYDRILKVERFRSQRLFNIHFSALPRYRGVFTSIWPILNGETESGVTLHRIDAGVDSGPIIAQRLFPLSGHITARQLYDVYEDEGTALFREWFSRLIDDDPVGMPQNEDSASYYNRRSLDLSSVDVDLTRSAEDVCRFVRGVTFPEYQLPTLDGRAIRSCAVIQGQDGRPARSIRTTTPLSTSYVAGDGRIVELIWA